MVVISLKFPARRFHATPWGRQVNEGAVEWPPSPWRLLRSLVAVWHHKFSEVPEAEVRSLVDRLATPPRFRLPAASQGHTRHYMPLANDDRTKIFDTFIALSPDDPVVAVWPEADLTDAQRDLLRRLLAAMTYFGRAESWVFVELLDGAHDGADVVALELGQEPPDEYELIRMLAPVLSEEHAEWYRLTLGEHRQRRLLELQASAVAKGKAADTLKLAKKDEEAIGASLPATLFDALHADTSALRKAGWNQPPGSRWLNYARPVDAFSPRPKAKAVRRRDDRPTLARFAVCGPVRPSLTEAVFFGDRVRTRLMGCSKRVRDDENTSPVFSGKGEDGTPSRGGHRHAHYLAESAGNDRSISHLNVFAPDGFDDKDELAFARLARDGVRRKDGNDLQLVLLGVGHPGDFGGISQARERAGRSRLLGLSKLWVSRTPFVLTRHLIRRGVPTLDAIAADPRLVKELIDAVRFELKSRPDIESDGVEIVPILDRERAGTVLGGHFTPWLKFRRDRRNGEGVKSTSSGFGFRLTFPKPVQGPIALGYGSHFGLGQFAAEG